MKNLLVMYKGGGHSGCFWEWSFCFWGSDGEWHDLYSSGRNGIGTYIAMFMALAENDSRIEYVVNLTNKEDIVYWVKEFNAYLVLNAAKILNDDHNYTIELPCKECGHLTAPEDLFYADKSTLVCDECLSSGSCHSCNDFVGEGNLNDMSGYLYDEGLVCGICKEKNLNRKRVAVDKHGKPLLKRCPGAYDTDSNEFRKEI